MLFDEQILRIPGPTPIPPSIQRAMNQPMIGHRDQETKILLREIQPKLKHVFKTKQEVLILSGSGTAGLETAVVNTAQPKDEVLVIVTGAFGNRFAQICDTYDMDVHRIDVEWGQAADPDLIKSYLQKNPNIKAVFATYCETSTGVLNPIRELAAIVKHNSKALFIVDGVSAIAGVEMEMDQWGIDIVVTGSQKALMLPPGLTFIAASERAWKVIERNDNPLFYFDLNKYRNSNEKNATPFTPALSLLFGLNQSLDLLKEEGLAKVYSRHRLNMNMTRAAFKGLNIPLLTGDNDASPTVTAVKPIDFNPDELRKILKDEFNLLLAGGQAELKGKIFRIGHMGYCSPADILQVINLIEVGLHRIGYTFVFGTGIGKAQEIIVEESY